MEASADGVSITDLVDRLIDAGISRREFATLLSQVGFLLQDEDLYEESKFSVTRLKLCKVDGQFPRIVRESFIEPLLMDRVFGLSYSVDLGPISEVAMATTALSEAASRLAGNNA
jgi:hypothetical protein